MRRPTKPVSRPHAVFDRSLLDENRQLIERIERRTMLRGSLSLGALTLLTGCDVTNRASVQSFFRAMSGFNDRVQALLFDPDKLAPTYTEADVLKPPRFNAFYPVEAVKPVDITTWKLELGGLIGDKRPWRIEQLNALPQEEIIIRHICVEGWDYIGQWSGVPLRLFLERVGADLSAKYVVFRSFDGYYSSIDMPTALHPQTQLSTTYAKEPLTDPFGFPLRLRTSTKLGFKNPKWITAIELTNSYPGGHWEDRGYNWYSGL